MEDKVESKCGGVQKEWVSGKVYSKGLVWVGWQEIWKWVFKKVGEKLAKMEVSFSGGETLRGRWCQSCKH